MNEGSIPSSPTKGFMLKILAFILLLLTPVNTTAQNTASIHVAATISPFVNVYSDENIIYWTSNCEDASVSAVINDEFIALNTPERVYTLEDVELMASVVKEEEVYEDNQNYLMLARK